MIIKESKYKFKRNSYIDKNKLSERLNCQSNNVKKITTVNRAVSTGIVGIASSKIGKQWHCNSCKSDF